MAPFRTLEDRYYGASVAQLADGRAFVLGGPSGSASSVLFILLDKKKFHKFCFPAFFF